MPILWDLCLHISMTTCSLHIVLSSCVCYSVFRVVRNIVPYSQHRLWIDGGSGPFKFDCPRRRRKCDKSLNASGGADHDFVIRTRSKYSRSSQCHGTFLVRVRGWKRERKREGERHVCCLGPSYAIARKESWIRNVTMTKRRAIRMAQLFLSSLNLRFFGFHFGFCLDDQVIIHHNVVQLCPTTDGLPPLWPHLLAIYINRILFTSRFAKSPWS